MFLLNLSNISQLFVLSVLQGGLPCKNVRGESSYIETHNPSCARLCTTGIMRHITERTKLVCSD